MKKKQKKKGKEIMGTMKIYFYMYFYPPGDYYI